MNENKMMEQVKNQFGIDVKRCCLSCASKDINEYGTRKCTKGVQKIRGDTVCDQWQMGRTFQLAGCSRGCIKNREYLMYALERRSLVSAPKHLTIKEIRREYEEKYGSIY